MSYETDDLGDEDGEEDFGGFGDEEEGDEDVIEVVEDSVDDDVEDLLKIDEEDDGLDTELEAVDLPDDTSRVSADEYLEGRNWWDESFFDFPVYRSLDWKYQDYVLLGVKMYGELVGFVSRHTWDKKEIVAYNKKQSRIGGYQILRYKNSDGNEMAKMLYGFDHIIEGETTTAFLDEGAMDVINLNQELGLMETTSIRAVATFGKKISLEQIFHLQSKGIKVVIMYDDDDF